MFDQTNKDNAHIVKYFKNKSALIVDPVGVNRTAIKKTLLNFGLTHNDIGNEDSFDSASEYIMENKPDLVFVKVDLKNDKGIDLLKKHEIVCPSRLEASFFLINEENDASTSCLVLETEVDGIFVTPFTVEGLENTVLKSLKKKFKPTPYSRSVEEGKEQLILENYDAAVSKFQEAADMNKTPVLANYYTSVICLLNNDKEKAEELLKQNIEQNPTHYKTLTKLTEHYTDEKKYKDAYDMAASLLSNYPLNPERIPEMTRLSIQNGQYEDIKNYSTVFSSLKSVSDQLKTYMSAGMAICGRFLCMQDKLDDGMKIITKAAKISSGKINILRNLAETFMKIGKNAEAIKLLQEYSTSDTDEVELQVLNFEIECSELDISKKIQKGRELLNKGFKHPKIYSMLIQGLSETGLKPELKEDLYYEACREYPDEIELFDSVNQSVKIAS